MAIQLIKLPGQRLWVEYDDIADSVLNIYNKAQITADIQAINATLDLPQYPKPSQVDNDVADLLTAIAGNWTETKRARIIALIQSMYQAYTGNDQLYIEAATLIARRDALIELRARLV